MKVKIINVEMVIISPNIFVTYFVLKKKQCCMSIISQFKKKETQS